MDELPSSKIGLHYSYTVHTLPLEALLRRPSCSVMGRIDVFDVLCVLLAGIVDYFACKWMQSNHYLRKFRHLTAKEAKFDKDLEIFSLCLSSRRAGY